MIDENKIKFAKKDYKEINISRGKWKVLIVDDSEEVHEMTEMVLKDFTFGGKSIEIIKAYNEEETKRIFHIHKDIAVVFMDIVMENDDSGLKLIEYIRKELRNTSVRIVIRTGHPGEAPEEEVFDKYNISDYREKTEMTSIKLYTCLKSALRNYIDIKRIRILLQEIYHRVRNNLQIMLSLVSIEKANCIENSHCGEILEKIKNRLNSISSVHDLLYETNEYMRINLRQHVCNIIQNDFIAFRENQKNIKLEIDIDNKLSLDINNSIPVGLIINEFVTNSLKHAFIDRPGIISVKTHLEDEILTLSIGDNGNRLPNDFDLQKEKSIGVSIIRGLLDQLNASIKIEYENEWKYFIIKFCIN